MPRVVDHTKLINDISFVLASDGIFVSPGDDKTLAEVVLKLYNNRAEVEVMGSSARKYVIEHFNRHKHAQAFVELAQQVTGKK